MPVLLRLLLCLTLLANMAGGAWAAQAMVPKVASPVAQAPCHMHDGVAGNAATLDHGGHADVSTMPRGAGAGGDHCADHGCNCLQHCAYSLAVPSGVAASSAPRTLLMLPQASDGRGLAQPYQPIRPPIV